MTIATEFDDEEYLKEAVDEINSDLLEGLLIAAKGSAGAAAIRRASVGGDITVTPEGISAPALVPGAAAAIAPYVKARKLETMAFLTAEKESNDPYFDQTIALKLIHKYLMGGPFEQVIGSTKISIPCVQGLAGGGKTFTLIESAKLALELGYKPHIVTPTNTANGVIKAAVKKSGKVSLDDVVITTAHKAFRSLELNELGEALMEMIASGGRVFAGGTTEGQSYVNTVLEKTTDAAFKRVQRQYEKEKAKNPQIMAVPCLHMFAMLGFPSLDENLCYWADTGADENCVYLMDEAGMLPRQMLITALNAGAKAVVFGDPYQLPPVQLYFTTADGRQVPDIPILSCVSQKFTVHLQRSRRNTEGSVIPLLAALCFSAPTPAAMRAAIKKYATESDAVNTYFDLTKVPVADLRDGITLQYTNKARFKANAIIRNRLGYEPTVLAPGERLSVARVAENNSLSKDERVSVSKVLFEDGDSQPLLEIDRLNDDGEITQYITPAFFGDDRLEGDPVAGHYMRKLSGFQYCGSEVWGNEVPVFTMAYAITVHKSQGAQWPVVTVDLSNIFLYQQDESEMKDDRMPLPDGRIVKSWRRLLYVAITRASSKINFIL